jgi:uncharacterized membrane protein
MKTVLASALFMGIVLLTGCDNKSSEGGPGASSKSPVVGQTENTFKISVPNATVKQGESKDIDVAIDRGKNFDQDVALKFNDLPTGVSVDPATPMLKHGDKDVKVTVKAADDAAIGDFKNVKVTGHPDKGSDTTVDMKVTVNKK